MSDSPLLILLVFAGALYLAKLWRDDYRAGMAGKPNPKALPGATGVSAVAMLVGAVGAVLLVLIETGGEIALGVSAEQTSSEEDRERDFPRIGEDPDRHRVSARRFCEFDLDSQPGQSRGGEGPLGSRQCDLEFIRADGGLELVPVVGKCY